MFNPQQEKSFSSQKQDQQGVRSIDANSSVQNGNKYILNDSLIRDGQSQIPSPNIDQNGQNKVSNTQVNKQQRVYSKKQHLHDKKVLNQSLQMMLSMNNAQKMNNLQIKGNNNNTYNDSTSHMTQPKNPIQSTKNPISRKDKLNLELHDHKTFSYSFRWIHICLVIIYSISAVVVSGILIDRFPQSSTYRDELKMVIDNWNQEMIEDIELFVLTQDDIKNKTSPQCSDKYENFFTVYGQNTVTGCNCKQSNYQQKQILQQACNTSQKQAGCTDIQDNKSPAGFNWETPDGNQIFNICIKRMKGLSYSSNGSQTSCEKQCGGSTEETKICVEQNQPCPINYLYFGKVAEDTTIPDLKQRKVGDYSLFYTTKGPGAPIVETRVSKGDGICFDNNIQNLYSTSFKHPLLDTDKAEVCTKIDDRFKKLMSLNEKQLYKDNYFDSIFAQIPDYQLSQTELYSVYTRTFIQISGNRRSSDIGNFKNSDSEYERVYDSNLAVLVTAAFYLVFVGIIYSTFSMLNIISKKYLFKQFLFDLDPIKVQTKSSIFKRLWVKIAFSLIHLTSILVAFIITLQNYLYLRTLNEGTVGDKYTVQLIKNLKNEYFEMILWFVVGNFIYFACLIILEVFILVPLCSKKLKEDTDTIISKKYLPQTGQNGQQQNYQSNNNQVFELPEYQTHNIYAGNGINTTINPFMQQMSVIGVDISAINRTYVNNMSVRNNKNNLNQNHKKANSNLNTSDVNLSILHPSIKNTISVQYNHTNNKNTEQNDGKYKPPLNVSHNQNDLSQFQKSNQDQYNSITNRTIDNLISNYTSSQPPSPNIQPKQQYLQNKQTSNIQQNNVNTTQNAHQNKQNASNAQQSKYQQPNINIQQNQMNNNNQDQFYMESGQNKSIFNISPSPIPHLSHNNAYSQQHIGDDSFYNQMTGLEIQSNEQFHPRTSHFNDEFQYNASMKNSHIDNEKNNFNEKQYQKKFSIDTLKDFGKNDNDQRNFYPQEEFNQHPMDRYLNKEMTSENIKSKNMNRNNYNLNDKQGMNGEKIQSNNQKQNNDGFNFQSVRSQNYISNQEINNNINRNIMVDPNYDNQEVSKNINQHRNDGHLNEMYRTPQVNNNRNIPQQNTTYFNQQNQQQNDFASFRNTNDNKNINNQNINSNPQYLKQMHKAQSRVQDKNDQDVVDPDQIDYYNKNRKKY